MHSASMLTFRALNSYLYFDSPTVYIQNAVWSPSLSLRRRNMANYVSSCNINPALHVFCFVSGLHKHVLKCTEEIAMLPYRDAQKDTADTTQDQVFMPAIPQWSPDLDSAARQTLLHIHSKHEQTTPISNTFTLVSKNSSFPFNICISQITMVLSIW